MFIHGSSNIIKLSDPGRWVATPENLRVLAETLLEVCMHMAPRPYIKKKKNSSEDGHVLGQQIHVLMSYFLVCDQSTEHCSRSFTSK